MTSHTIADLTFDDLLDIVIPPVRAVDPPVIRDWKAVAIRAQQDIRRGGRGSITVSSAAASMRLALTQLRNEGVLS